MLSQYQADRADRVLAHAQDYLEEHLGTPEVGKGVYFDRLGFVTGGDFDAFRVLLRARLAVRADSPWTRRPR